METRLVSEQLTCDISDINEKVITCLNEIYQKEKSSWYLLICVLKVSKITRKYFTPKKDPSVFIVNQIPSANRCKTPPTKRHWNSEKNSKCKVVEHCSDGILLTLNTHLLADKFCVRTISGGNWSFVSCYMISFQSQKNNLRTIVKPHYQSMIIFGVSN